MGMEDWTNKNVVMNNVRMSLTDLYKEQERLKEQLYRVEVQIEKHETVLEHLEKDTEDIDDE